MIDLNNLPQPSELALKDFPGISAALIREAFVAGNIDYLVSLFDFIQRSKHRAEALAQVYFNQMEILHKRLNAARNPENVASRSGSVAQHSKTKSAEPTDVLLLDL